MRLSIGLLTTLLWLLVGASAHAASVSFGSATNNTSCSQAGNGADRSCTSFVSSGGSSFNVRGQASADHGLTTNATAIADISVSYDIPYTVTRTVTIVEPPGPSNNTASFETFDVNFTFDLSGRVGHDNSQVGGGLANAIAYTTQVQSLSGLFTTASFGGASNGGGGGPSSTPYGGNQNRSLTITLNFSGAGVGEINNGSALPGDFRSWDDLLPTFHPTTENGGVHVQSISDTLRVTFRLRAESRPSGSVSTTGGEAIACAGQTSPLGAFDLDNGLNCGSGVTGNVSISNLGSAVVALPEPAVLALVGAGLVGLALSRRRRG